MNVVLDWDGTVTEEDTLVMVLARFGDWDVFQRAASALERGEITLNEEIRRDFEPVTAALEEVVGWLLEHVRVRPGFHELAAEHPLVVVSSGFHELIEPILQRERVQLAVRANRLDARPDGWRVLFRSDDVCASCGEPCKRESLPADPVAYVGDGYSDRCAALAAQRVFARDGLAAYLAERGVPFTPFDDLNDVRTELGRVA